MRSSKWVKREEIKQYNPAGYICVFFILLALISNGGKLFLAIVYDIVLEKMNEINVESLFLIGISSAIVIIIISAINWIQKVFGEKCRQKKIADRQKIMLEELGNKKLDRVEKILEGEWTTLLSDDIEQCSDYFFEFVLPFSVGVILFLASICVGFYLSPNLTVVIIICSIASLLIPKFFIGKISKTYDNKIHNKEKLQEQLIRPLHFKSLIKAYYYEEKCENNFEMAYRNYAKECIEEKKLSAAMTGISIGSAFTISSLWMVIGIFLIIDGSVTVGEFAAFMMLSDYLNWPFTEMGSLLAERTKANVSSERLRYYLSLENEECEIKEIDEPNQISFMNVSFLYEDSNEMIIEEKSISLEEKDRIAIVGESGRGKTTLCKLIAGGYYPFKGNVSISFEGKKYFKGALRNIVGYMPQKSHVFSGTIEENIGIGKEGATKEEIRNAARIACVDRFVNELPEGYETVIGTNSKIQLSGGQIARIALARTLIRPVPIYILDEFSAALDDETEMVILNNLSKVDAVLICVTHKMRTMDFCNKRMDVNVSIQ